MPTIYGYSLQVDENGEEWFGVFREYQMEVSEEEKKGNYILDSSRGER
jgi:hypothetical protein